METIKYPITIKRDIPYISDFFYTVFIFSALILAITIFILLPPLGSHNEMKVVAGIKSIPENVIWTIFYSSIGFIIFLILYKKIAIYSSGIFSFNADTILISTKNKISQIPIQSITRIELINPTNRDEDYIGKFFVVIHQRNGDILHFRLKEYLDSDSFIDHLLTHDNLKYHIKELNRTFLSEENI